MAPVPAEQGGAELSRGGSGHENLPKGLAHRRTGSSRVKASRVADTEMPIP